MSWTSGHYLSNITNASFRRTPHILKVKQRLRAFLAGDRRRVISPCKDLRPLSCEKLQIPLTSLALQGTQHLPRLIPQAGRGLETYILEHFTSSAAVGLFLVSLTKARLYITPCHKLQQSKNSENTPFYYSPCFDMKY